MFFYYKNGNNSVLRLKHELDPLPEGYEVITKEEFKNAIENFKNGSLNDNESEPDQVAEGENENA